MLGLKWLLVMSTLPPRTFEPLAAAEQSAAAPQAKPPKPARKRIEADDGDIELPEDGSDEDTLGAVDENWDPDDDSDLGLDGEDEREEVGLDTATGPDDALDTDSDLDDSGEGVRWTADNEEAEDLPGADADLLDGEEYGWTGPEDTQDDDDDFDPGIADDAPVSLDDGGAEGVDDDTELDDYDLSILPAMDADAEEEADEISADALDDMADDAAADESVVEVAAGLSWQLLPLRSVRRTELATLGAKVQALAVAAGHVVLCSDAVYRVGAAGLRPAGLSLEGQHVTGLAVCEHEGHLRIALATGAALYVSTGATGPGFVEQGFVEHKSAPGTLPEQLGYTVSARGVRLWALGLRGVLEVSDDDGATFSDLRLAARASQLATDGVRRVVALAPAARDASVAQVFRSNDASGRFVGSEVRALGADAAHASDAVTALVACRDALLLSCDGRALCGTDDQHFVEVAAGSRWPAVLLDEDDEVFVYACVPHGAKLLLVRRAVRDTTREPMVVTVLDPAQLGEPRALVASYAEGFVTLHLATDTALHRIEASLDGEELA